MSDYSYDRRAASKTVPVSQRPVPEQVRYWTSFALSSLKAGSPTSAAQHLKKAESLLDKDPELKTNAKLRKLLEQARHAAYGPSPRAADYIVKDALALLPEKG